MNKQQFDSYNFNYMQVIFFAKFKYEYIVITITELRKRKMSRKER